jgi:hypothetical protein
MCCAILEGTGVLEIIIDRITVDGNDSTQVLLNSLNKTEADVIILGGATFAGFNVVDVAHIYNVTEIPVIVYSDKYPDIQATYNALRKHFPDWEMRWSRYEALGAIHELKIGEFPAVYYEKMGCNTLFAEKVLMEQAITCRIPEAVRVADLIAKGVSPIFQNREGCAGKFSGQ